MTLHADLEAYAQTCYAAAKRILEGAPIWGSTMEPDDPKVLAALLIVRTLSNFDSVLILARKQKVVETRVLARCCLENLFTATAISEEGEKFVRKMVQDHNGSRRARAEFLLAAGLGSPDDELRAYIRSLGKPTRRPNLAPKEVAQAGPLSNTYAEYSELSADAAHPTIDALYRYMETLYENGVKRRNIVCEPVPDMEEITSTVLLACRVLLGVCAMAHAVVNGPPDDEFGELIRTMSEREAEYVRKIKQR
jgi:hypothetical protein